jgi:integrase
VEWGKLLDSPARGVKRLRVENTRTRILTVDEQRRLLGACAPKLRGIATVALISSARIGEVLSLRWEQCKDGYMTFLRTKNGRARRIPISRTLEAVLSEQPRLSPWVFTNPRTDRPYVGVASSFKRALERAKITTGDVTVHTLRHTALSRMIDAGFDDYTVMAISGHSSTRMRERYTHPTELRKKEALDSFSLSTQCPHEADEADPDGLDQTDDHPVTVARARVGNGGPHGARTHDLRVANAALSQLS